MPKRNKTGLLGRRYVADILAALSKSPKRFSDISKSCPNEKTRSSILKDLKDSGLVEPAPLKRNKRYFIHYKLTAKGKKIYQKMTELEKILGSN